MIRLLIPYRKRAALFLVLSLFALPRVFGQDSLQQMEGGGDKVWSLRECIDHAHKNNIQVRQQKLSVQSSDLDRKQAYYDLLPDLNAFGTHGYNWGQRVDQFTNQFVTQRVRSNSFSLSSSMTLFQGMQRFRNIRQQEYRYEAQKARVEEVKNNIALQIANAYLQVLFNKEILDVAREQKGLTRMQVKRVRDLYDAGEVAKGEVLELESQLESERSNLVQSRNDLQLSRLDLIQLLQLDGGKARSFSVKDAPESERKADSLEQRPRTIYRKAIGEMPSIKAAELSIRSAEEELAIAQGGRSPTLSLSGSYGTGFSGMRKEMVGEPEIRGYDTVGVTAPSGEAVLTPRYDQETRTIPFWDQFNDNLNQNLGLQLNIPIFQRMSTNTQIKKARIGLEQARLEEEAARDQLRQDVQQAYADALAAQRKYRASKKAVKAREESFSYAQARYKAGAIATVDYVDSKTRLMQARSELLQAKYEKLFKRKVLRFYMGDPLTLEE